jgi:hypothetical protein
MELFTKSRQFFQNGLQIDVDARVGLFLSYRSSLVAKPRIRSLKITSRIWQAFARRSKRGISNSRSKDASGSIDTRRMKVHGANRGNGFALFDFGHFLAPSHCLFRMTFGSRKLVVLRPPWDSFTSGSLFLFLASGCFFATGFGSIRTVVRDARRAPRPRR